MSGLTNKTRVQHYISQAEQRLNSINPSAPKKKREIFRFEVTKEPDTRLGPPSRVRIHKALSFTDLFSFAIDDNGLRENFESLFKTYEDEIRQHTEEILIKLEGGSPLHAPPLFGVFRAKFLNFLRNPHCVQKILNSVGDVWAARFTDPKLEEVYQRVTTANEESMRATCAAFQISESNYIRWTRALFMLLESPPSMDSNMFEQVIDALFQSQYCHVAVYTHPNARPEHVCLLSDRGFNMLTQENGQFMTEFNLTSRAFIVFIFADVMKVAPQIRPDLAKMIMEEPKINLLHLRDNVDMLRRYNARTAYQCAKHVYAAHENPVMPTGGEP